MMSVLFAFVTFQLVFVCPLSVLLLYYRAHAFVLLLSCVHLVHLALCSYLYPSPDWFITLCLFQIESVTLCVHL